MKGKNIYLKAKLIQKKMYQIPSTSPTRNNKEKLLYGKYLLLIRKAAYLGNADAQYELALTYEDMNYLYFENPYFNPKKCIYWYTKACNQNHADACNNLASFYERGMGCKQNIKQAVILYKKSSDLGHELGKKNYKLILKQIKQGYKFKK